MFDILATVLLVVAFGILVWTFVWIARLLAHHSGARKRAREKVATPLGQADEMANREGVQVVRGRGYGANYGLLLGALSCALYWWSPLVVALPLVGIFFSARAIVNGVRHFRIVIWRGIIGLLLNMAGLVLPFLVVLKIIPTPL